MKTIVRGAIVPALIVASLQCMVECMCAFVVLVLQPKNGLSIMSVGIALSQAILLIGAAVYAGILRHRSRASLSGCTVGGAAVGLLANLATQAVHSVLIFLMAAVMMDRTVWTAVLVTMLVSYLFYGIGGLFIGEVGGGAVGLLSLRRAR